MSELQVSVWDEIQNDLRDFGVCITRRKADGSIERIDPTGLSIRIRRPAGFGPFPAPDPEIPAAQAESTGRTGAVPPPKDAGPVVFDPKDRA